MNVRVARNVPVSGGHAMPEEDEKPNIGVIEFVGESEVEIDALCESLKRCYDPEIPANVVDLGLIYALRIEGAKVDVTMTLTAIGCPVAGEVMAQIQDEVCQTPNVESCTVNLTFDPPWTPEKMNETAKWDIGWV